MNPPKAQEGLRPAQGLPRPTLLVKRPLAELWYVARTSQEADSIFAEGGAVLEAVPATLATELAEALEECIQLASEGWGYASPYFGEKWQCDKDIAKAVAALDSYRARTGEGE